MMFHTTKTESHQQKFFPAPNWNHFQTSLLKVAQMLEYDLDRLKTIWEGENSYY